MEKQSDKTLLYDPMFERNSAESEIDKEPKSKTLVKKAVFIVVLTAFVGLSMLLSFSSISGEKVEYEEIESGYMLSSFTGSKNNIVLNADFIVDENGNSDLSKPITQIREFAICCDEYTQYIYIGKDVQKIEASSFYYCKALKAVFVDGENEKYASVDGVLYRKENGVITEIILYPIMNGYYRAAVALGFTAPETADGIQQYIEHINSNEAEIKKEYERIGKKFSIPETVEKIGDLCFNTCTQIEEITLPASLREIGSMAFFECEALKAIDIPDGVEKIGSDAFSKCKTVEYIFVPESVKEIGHHAFYDCSGVDEIYLGHSDASALTLGENWLPQKRNIILKDIQAVYRQERSE